MRKIILIFLICVSKIINCQNAVPLIPKPNTIEPSKGFFVLTANTTIFSNNESLQKEIEKFNVYLKKQFNFVLNSSSKNSSNQIELYDVWSSNFPEGKRHEWYQLEISENKILINADSTGAFYAFETLKQLIEFNFTNQIQIPCAKIFDSPSYKWRGMHLDVCRHFFPIEFIKKYIDVMAMYKFNTFHWHLTDDQGWRIEIKKYPLLTSVGAYRKGSMIGKYDDKKFDTINYGGFYTQEQIKEIVNYAQQKQITVVPEIEMPGHSVAAIASYPFLSCSGKKIEVEKSWGVFDDVYCTKDSTFTFLETVLEEVMALFPSKYIHIGGDECPKESWKKCKTCQANKIKNGLKDEHELQSYFIKRIEKFVNSKGRQIIGWDEILEGGLAPNAAVMSWRGTQGGIDAAKQKHFVVMSPGKPCYFDHYQTKNKKEEPLAIGGFNPLDSVYNFNPMPKNLSVEKRKFILGAQANVWTEYILNEKQVEYMAIPRMIALSEALWTKAENKNYKDFIARLKIHTRLLDDLKINYAKHFLH